MILNYILKQNYCIVIDAAKQQYTKNLYFYFTNQNFCYIMHMSTNIMFQGPGNVLYPLWGTEHMLFDEHFQDASDGFSVWIGF